MTVRRVRRTHAAILAALTTVGVLTGCTADVEDDSGAATQTTVNRCGEAVEYRVPQRAVVYEGGSADKMFSLGLADHVHGYVMPPANPPVTESPWADDYAGVESSPTIC